MELGKGEALVSFLEGGGTPTMVERVMIRPPTARIGPITPEERNQREEKARRLMQTNNLDAILLTEGTTLNYFTGIRWWGGERLFAMVLPVKGAAFYVCPAFEEGRAREQIAKAPDGERADVRIWQEDESPYQRVAGGLKDRGLVGGKLGIEETVHFVFTDGISQAAPQVKLLSATPVTAGCRMIKSDHEIELMRLAAKVTLAAYEATWRSLKEGRTYQAGIFRLSRRAGRRVRRFPAWIGHAAGHPRRDDHTRRRWLQSGRLHLRHQPNVCARKGDRQDETSL